MRPNDPEYPRPSSAVVVSVMKANKRSNTKPEILIRKFLHAQGYRFRKDFLLRVSEHKCRPDIVFTRKKVAVFIDGCFWHSCPTHGHVPRSNTHYWTPKLQRNSRRDNLDTEALMKSGWKVIRLWEHTSIEESLALIKKVLKP